MRFCERAQTRPKCWIQASAVGIYPTRSNQAIDETTPAGTGFAPELCLAIEARVAQAQQLGLRGVSMRLGLILGKNGGVFPTLRLATRLAGGVVVGDGTQRVAWVHLADVIGCIGAALAPASTLQEAINVVAPHAPTYREFIGAIASALHRPSVISAPKAIMRLALGERAPLLLEGAEILPKVLLANGFQFRHCTLESALKQLCP